MTNSNSDDTSKLIQVPLVVLIEQPLLVTLKHPK